MLTGSDGITVLSFEDDLPRWHRSFVFEGPYVAEALFASDGVAPDGSVTLTFRSAYGYRHGRICMSDLPCFEHPEGLIVRLSGTGEVEAAWVVPNSLRAIEVVDGGDVIVGSNRGFARYAPDGRVRWENRSFGSWPRHFALDARTGRMRASFGIPDTPLELLGTTLRDCIDGFPWSATTDVLCTLDPATGEVLSLDGRVSGQVRGLHPHPDGGIVVAIQVNRSTSVELCGGVHRRGDRTEGPIDFVVAHLD